jgi:DNA adenine methylase
MATSSRLILRSNEAPRLARRPAAAAAPVIKWAGGKTRLLGHLISRCPMQFRRYFEPFFGGGALFFRMVPPRAVLSDLNEDLMNVYRCVAWNVEAVIQRLHVHQREHEHDYYYTVRERWNDRKQCRSEVDRAAAFIYLNKTCYNGLYRVNQRGHFNVPIGRYESPTICDPDQLRATSRVLQRAELCVGHFAERVEDAAAGDFVYFDPPYDPVTRTANFTGYTAGSFGDDDQHELARIVGDLTDRGVFVMLSNSDTPFIRELYRGFRIDTVEVARAINSRASARGPVNEVIITNGYVP